VVSEKRPVALLSQQMGVVVGQDQRIRILQKQLVDHP